MAVSIMACDSNSDEQSHSDLEARFASGDVACLDEVYTRYEPQLRRWLTRTFAAALDSSDVDDVISTTLWRAWAGRERFDPERALGAWLFTIARNAAMEMLRARPRLEALDEFVASPVDTNPESARDVEPEEDAHRAADHIVLRSLLEKLDELDLDILRAATRKRDEDEEWTKELAIHYGISPGTLRVRKYRLMKKLGEDFGRLRDLGEDNDD